MCKSLELTETILNTFVQIEKEFKNLKDEIESTNDETQDILHDIELSNFNAAEGYFMAKKIQDVRRRRRQAKDEMEKLNMIYTYISQNQNIRQKLLDISRKIKTREENQQHRIYAPRARVDLKLLQQKVI